MKSIFGMALLFAISGHCFAQTTVEARLDAVFSGQFPKGAPGGAVIIVKQGKVVYRKGFGVEDMQSGKPISPASLFNLGSISKTFVANGILRLAQEGKLSLNDSLEKYFKTFRHPEFARRVKIVHLLTHTSGLPDNRNVEADSLFYLTAKDAENWAPVMQTDTLEFEPGENWHYSNPAFNALALIIEQITRMKWQQYIQRLIFDPSGMTRSTITDGAHPQSGVAHGYLKTAAGGYIERDYGEEPTFCAAGNGGVWSSVDELWKYQQAMQRNVFLNREWTGRSREIHRFNNWKQATPPFMGLSWFILEQAGNKMIGHTGTQGGFNGDYVWIPGKELFYVLLCNQPQPLERIRQSVLDIVLQRL
jgi:CubicO group peptidase (beta-lactamase class C family)